MTSAVLSESVALGPEGVEEKPSDDSEIAGEAVLEGGGGEDEKVRVIFGEVA